MMLSAEGYSVLVALQMEHREWSMILRIYGRWIPEVNPQAGEKAVQAWTVPIGNTVHAENRSSIIRIKGGGYSCQCGEYQP